MSKTWKAIEEHLRARGLSEAECCALLNECREEVADDLLNHLNGTFYRKNPFPRWRFTAREAWFAGVNAASHDINMKRVFWARLAGQMRNPRKVHKRA